MIGYAHQVLLEIGGSYTFDTLIYFSKEVNQDSLLLGTKGFFDRFIVKIDAARESIELTPNKSEKKPKARA